MARIRRWAGRHVHLLREPGSANQWCYEFLHKGYCRNMQPGGAGCWKRHSVPDSMLASRPELLTRRVEDP